MVAMGRAGARFLTVFLAFAGISLTTGCGVDESSDVSDPYSYPKLAAKWPTPVISVCWEGAADRYPTEKSWVRGKVESQYEGRTRLRFEGWGRCVTGAKGVRITVADGVGDNPHTQGLGRALDGVVNGMELNFTFENWSKSCQSSRRRCVESIGVHEFGHAIGLAHEHNRPDTPRTCTESKQGTKGDRSVGSWDVNSVMNYCNPVYNNGGNLSAGDVRGIATLYGEPRG